MRGLGRLPGLPGLSYQDGLPKLPELDAEPKAAHPAGLFESIPLRPTLPGRRRSDLEAMAIQDPTMTLPERIIGGWLIKAGFSFEMQRPLLGGRTAGGAVVDFLIYDMIAQPVALRVQGDYWHGPKFPDRRARDDEQALRLREAGYIPVDLWESDIYQAAEYKRLTAYIEGEVLGAV